MKLREIEVADVRMLEKLVAEHIDGIEPGLAVIDSRLLLGHATIDLVAQDASGSLVLIALGFRADESLILRIVDAYSWCLEYPESVQRHYPTLSISEERPPRVIFVMSRVPESFQRKIKQLSFSSVDAVEFHHFDVDGTPAMYFDTVARIRRGAGAPLAPDIAARPEPRPEPVHLATEIASRLNGGRPAPKKIEVSEIDTPRVVTPRTITPAAAVAAITMVAETSPVRIAAPLIAGASDVVAEVGAPRISETRLVEPAAPIAVPVPAIEVIAPAVESVVAGTIAPEIVTETVAVAEPEPEPVVAVVEAPKVEAPKVEAPKVEAPKVEAPRVEAPKAEAPTVDGDPNAKYPFSEAAKAAKLAQELGIQLPTEGALTRQWIDFLNQLAAK